MLGRDGAGAARAGLLDLVHPDDQSLCRGRGRQRRAARDRVPAARTSSASGGTLEAHVTDLRDDRRIRGMVLNARDVTERVRLEEELTQQAFHDGLTGWPTARCSATGSIKHSRAPSAHGKGSGCSWSISTVSSRSTTASATMPATSCCKSSRGASRRHASERHPRPPGGRRVRRSPRRRDEAAAIAVARRLLDGSRGPSRSRGASSRWRQHRYRRSPRRNGRRATSSSGTPTSRCTPPRKRRRARSRCSGSTWLASSASYSGLEHELRLGPEAR